MDCEYMSSCLNKDKCFRCNNYSLLKLKNQRGRNNTSSLISSNRNKELSAEDSWKDLEQQVADKLNNIPSITEARRSIASGALPFEKGDIVDSILHPECKERTGKELKSGEKSISIKKEWLTKAYEECKMTDKTMCLPFRFKGDDEIYTIVRNDDLMALVTTMKSYIRDNELKDMEIERLKKK